MRRSIFSFALLMSILALANSASAQTSFEMAEMQGAMTYEGGISPAGYYGRYDGQAMQLPSGPNSNWGYSGTCCSNVWAGYCEENQGCPRCGHHRNAGCCKTSLWQRLMCARPKLFGNSNCCGRSQCRGCGRCRCSSGATNCGAGNCGMGYYGPLNGENSGAAGAEEVMPMPPQSNLPEKLPYDGAASPADDNQSSVRRSWSMPRITSSRVKSRG